MLRFAALSAAFAVIATAAIPTYAADYDGEYDYEKSVEHRPVAKDYDEDNDASSDRGRGYGRWNHRHLGRNMGRVEAQASYSGDHAPYYVKEQRAKRSAIEAWKAKVSRIYGERFAHWRAATDQNVACDAAAGTIYCTASARPQRGWSRWGGWRGDDRNRY